ncbi:MAG: ABC transporter permease [Planctomycetota bacterium]
MDRVDVDRRARRRRVGGRVTSLAGACTVLVMLVGCLATLPYTFGRTPGGDPALATASESTWQRRYEATTPELGLLPPFWARHAPDEQARVDAWIERTGERPRPLLGTDKLGRDLFIRCLAGGGISLAIGFSAALLAIGIGTLYGTLSATGGRRVDAAMMRVVDVLYGLPYILLVVLLAVAADGIIDRIDAGGAEGDSWVRNRKALINILTLLVAIGGVSWLTMARVIRGQVLSLKEQPFMEACRAIGVPMHRQFRYHLLPNLIGPIIVYTTLAVPQAILSESFLSFLGIGVKEPLPSWGNLAAAGLNELNSVRVRWWLLAWPCLFIGMTLLALNFVGEALREAFDPRRRMAGPSW